MGYTTKLGSRVLDENKEDFETTSDQVIFLIFQICTGRSSFYDRVRVENGM